MYKKRTRISIGLRTAKTTAAIVISMILVYFYGTTESRYIFAVLGAMAAMEHTFQESLEACLTQIIGVVFGAVASLVLLYLPIHTVMQCAIGILLTITLYQALHIRFSPALPCMMIVIMCTTSGIQPVPYAVGRFWDTAIGLIVGMLINTLVFPYDNTRRIRSAAESLDKEVLAFLEELFDGDSILPDPAIMVRNMEELERQLQIFAKQKFLFHARWQSQKLQQFRECDIKARQLVAYMEALCYMDLPGCLNEENREQLVKCGANIRDVRKTDPIREIDIVTNYHVAKIMTLRQSLLDTLTK